MTARRELWEIANASTPLLVRRSEIGRAADRGRLSVSTSCSGHISGSRRRFERPFGQRAIRPLVLVGRKVAIADNPSDTSCRAVSVFRRRPCQDRFSPRRVNGESFFDPRRLPSMSASLVRVACAATSAKSPATSARFCHRASASGAPFSPLRTACAVSVRPTPASVIPEPGYPFRPSSRTFRSEPYGRGVERRSSTSAITGSDPRAQPPDRSTPRRLDIEYRSSFFCGPAVIELLLGPKPFADLSMLSPGCCHRVRGRPSLSRAPAESPGFQRFRAFFSATPLLPQLRCRAHTSRRRARGES